MSETLSRGDQLEGFLARVPIVETLGMRCALEQPLDHPDVEDLYARARVIKLGRRMASATAEAWQSERDKPVATLHGHFLLKRS